MKREIKFRGKRIDNGEWIYGFYASAKGKKDFIVQMNYLGLCIIDETHEVYPDSVGQLTGLVDKDGVDLNWWEDDVFSHASTDYSMIIVLEDGCFWFKISTGRVRYKCYDVITGWKDLPKKIGNAYDNPKLMETK